MAPIVGVLQHEGHHVVTAMTGAQALGLCATVLPDVALVQQSLPGELDAPELAVQLQRRGPVPSIFLLDDDRLEALERLVAAFPLAMIPQRASVGEALTLVRVAMRQAAALRAARDPDARFFATALDLLCFLDFNGYFRRLSPMWERALGWTREELMARPFIEFVHPDDRERTLAQNRSVRGGGEALGFENRYLCKGGGFRWLRWNAAPDAAQNVIYSVARDVTEQKLAVMERERLIGELQQALAEVKSLQEIIPICSYCRKVRDDDDFWQHVEAYIHTQTGSRFSHGVCPDCHGQLLRDFAL